MYNLQQYNNVIIINNDITKNVLQYYPCNY